MLIRLRVTRRLSFFSEVTIFRLIEKKCIGDFFQFQGEKFNDDIRYIIYLQGVEFKTNIMIFHHSTLYFH